jgi:hypothetical protein
MTTVKAVAATGQLGTGFKTESLAAAAEGADFIACDAGSTDPGPHYLGSGSSQSSEQAAHSDLSRILPIAVEHGIPAIVGSAGTAGGRPHLERVANIVRTIAQEQGLHFSFATIDTELAPEVVADAFRAGRLKPLYNAPELTVEEIMGTSRIVAMAGPEPYEEALRQGAQVVLGGRSSDTSLYVAVPHMRGIPMGVAYHAAKILECGAASAILRHYPDSMAAVLDQDGFTIEPPNPDFACSPQSVAAHTLYENSDPFLLVEPGGTMDSSDAVYEAVSDRAVRVTNSKYTPADKYTVRLEAATLRGYRTVVVAGVRDPLLLMQLDEYIASATDRVGKKVKDSLGLEATDYRMRWLVYGQNGAMGSLEPNPVIEGHEVGVVIDIVAKDQKTANAISSIAWHTTLHHPIKQYHGLISSLAFPFSPPALEAGPVYEFSINHVLELDDPLAMGKITVTEL